MLFFAKNFYNLTLKGGILQNSGGVGADYYLVGRKLRLSLEAFRFSDLNLRSFARYDIIKGVYVIGGGDDLLDSSASSAFFGGGIFITNDDLKSFASALSF